MINLNPLDLQTFLSEYWQKKPLLIRQALPEFTNPLSADELAGLALEEDVESRIVFETPGIAPHWQLKSGPFTEDDFAKLPPTHWTLLVQGVDRLIPDVANLLDYFNFIPSWRIDDVMISYAAVHGSVGPHYDNYDVFLYQAAGHRKWSLTTKNCHVKNYLNDVPLRIMKEFIVEEEYILAPGDMLYLPPHVAHHGVSLDDDCMTYSFGYRSYQGQEMWESLGDYLSEQGHFTTLYQDPNWYASQSTAVIQPEAWMNAKQLLQQAIADDQQMQSWFGCFVTSLDRQAEQQLPLPLTEEESGDLIEFINELTHHEGLLRDASCRFAYIDKSIQLFVNGCKWHTEGVSPDLIRYVANHRFLTIRDLRPFLAHEDDQIFLFELWRLQWLELV